MNNPIHSRTFSLLAYGLAGLAAPVLLAAELPDPPYATGHVLIKLRKSPVLDAALRAHARPLEELGRRLGLPRGAALEESQFVRLMKDRRQGKWADTSGVDLDQFLYLRLPSDLAVPQAVERFKEHPLLEYAEPDYIAQAGGVTPNDTNFGSQWNLRNTFYTNGRVRADIHIQKAWAITTGSSNVIVAVVDSGINAALSEFAGRLVAGYDFVNSDSNPADDQGHGTSMASMLAANADNTNFIAGVDWQCRIMPVKTQDQDGNGFYSAIASGINFAVQNGAKVMNLSSGGTVEDSTLRNAILNAIAQGVIFVTITHNDGSGTIRFPGRMPEAITVGATTCADRRPAFSNYGAAIDLVAPGASPPTLSLQGGMYYHIGTSFSAPQVAGVAALIASLHPTIRQAQVEALLRAGADDQVGDATDTTGFDPYHGWGRLNAFNTLRLAQLGATNSTDVLALRQILQVDRITNPDLHAEEPATGPPVSPQVPVRWMNFTGHGDELFALDYSSLAGLIVSASSELNVRIWDARTGMLLRSIAPGNRCGAARFAPDGATVATGDVSGSVRLWNTANGSLLRTLSGHSSTIRSVVYSPDGQSLASASKDATIKLWRATDGALLRTLGGHAQGANVVAFSPAGDTVASGGEDALVRLWNVASGQLLRTFTGHVSHVWSVAFSSDGSLLASAGGDHTIRLWQVTNGALVRVFAGDWPGVRSVEFLRDGTTLVSGSYPGESGLHFWRVSDGTHRLAWFPPSMNTYQVRVARFSPDGDFVYFGLGDGGLVVADNPFPPLRLLDIARVGDEVTLRWRGNHKLYQVQKKTSLTETNWQNSGSPTAGTNFTDTTSGSNAFYRIQGLQVP